MVSESVVTTLTADEALKQALAFLLKDRKLKLIELAAHLGDATAGIAISVSGETLKAGGEDYEPRRVLEMIVGYAEEAFGLSIFHYSLHWHPAADESGHLLVQIDHRTPVVVSVESQDLDAQARAFLSRLPK